MILRMSRAGPARERHPLLAPDPVADEQFRQRAEHDEAAEE
jgi:hypothetical protein